MFISAAEPSADLHAAHLIMATRRLRPEVRFVGVAGPRMVVAGCEPIFDMTGHASMLLGALANIGRGIAMLNACDGCLRRHHFDAAVVVDSPTLHLPLAGKANTLGIPVLYFIAPQMWAWGKYRIFKLRHRAARVACILPFEEKFFRNEGVEATFVGHPLAEEIADTAVDLQAVRSIRSRGRPLVALLPGSRRHVVESVLPGQLEVARQVKNAFPNAGFGVSVAGTQVVEAVSSVVARSGVCAELFAVHSTELIQAADLVLVASGTAALEVAFLGRPMIVMYNASRAFYHLIARWLIHTPYLSLPNILAQREIVPEFMPFLGDTAPIAKRAIEILSSPAEAERMCRDLAETTAPLRNGSASTRTAELLLEMIGTGH